MWLTTEVRWFYRLPEASVIPEPLWRWFENLPGSFESELERVDHYLLLEDAADLGVKVREGRLEVKYRLARPDAAFLSPRGAGLIEQWGKWAITVGPAETGSTPRLGFPWQAVSKKRWLRCYRPDQQQSISPPPLREGQFGCDLELTRVQLRGDTWWSLGIEAYGRSEESRQDLLCRIAGQILNSGRPPELDLSASMGYPRWLALNE